MIFAASRLSLPGAFQFNNAAIAVTLFLLWLQRARPREARTRIEAAIRAGLRETRWPGRLEIIAQDPLTVIDVGHTPDGIRQSLASLKAIHGGDDWILVTGVSGDKKADEIVGALAPSFDTIICTAAHHKGADARRTSPPRHGAPIRRRIFMSPIRSRTRCGLARNWRRRASGGSTWRADCFWRSNTRRSRRAAARRI